MAQSLFEHGRIKTTLPKAKEVRGFVEKLITLARHDTLFNRRRVVQLMQDRRVTDKDQEFIEVPGRKKPLSVVQKLFDEIGPRFSDRPGGYTRIIKLSDYRIGDGSSLCLLSLVGDEEGTPGRGRRSVGLRRLRADKRRAFMAQRLKSGPAGAATTGAATTEAATPDNAPAAESESAPEAGQA